MAYKNLLSKSVNKKIPAKIVVYTGAGTGIKSSIPVSAGPRYRIPVDPWKRRNGRITTLTSESISFISVSGEKTKWKDHNPYFREFYIYRLVEKRRNGRITTLTSAYTYIIQERSPKYFLFKRYYLFRRYYIIILIN